MLSRKWKNLITKLSKKSTIDRETAKMFALSSGNVIKFEYMTGKDVLPEKDLLKNSCNDKI